jgi:hypothetical protein
MYFSVLGVYGHLVYYVILHLNFLITSDKSILDRYASNSSSFSRTVQQLAPWTIYSSIFTCGKDLTLTAVPWNKICHDKIRVMRDRCPACHHMKEWVHGAMFGGILKHPFSSEKIIDSLSSLSRCYTHWILLRITVGWMASASVEVEFVTLCIVIM